MLSSKFETTPIDPSNLLGMFIMVLGILCAPDGLG